MRKRRVRIVIGSILTLLMVVAALLALCFKDNHINRYELYVRSFFWGRESFDSAEWQQHHPFFSEGKINAAACSSAFYAGIG